MSGRFLTLVTNDDGILSPGLRVLERVASRLGDVLTVAPENERSGVSHAITLTEPIRARDLGQGRWALSGTPADCVFIGVNHVLCGRKPDLILSGINRGPNLGFDVMYSGTVGAAMEGVIQQIPSVALSLVSRGAFDFEAVEPRVEEVVRKAVAAGMPAGVMLNVNVPDETIAPFQGWRVTRLGNRHYSSDVIARVDPRGGEYLWIGGTRVTMETAPDSDCGAVHEGYGSITPLRPDLLARDAMTTVRGLEAM